MFTISTFYKFFDNSNYQSMAAELKEYAASIGVKGTVILAKEGLNATISGSQPSIDKMFAYMKNKYDLVFSNIKNTYFSSHPFNKLKIKTKNEIVTLGISGIGGKDPGHYIKPEMWDEFITKSDVVVIDTRNDYEVEAGAFKDAINPNTQTFGEFPAWFLKHQKEFEGKKIAMYCTGGIRCEKSTTYLKSLGIKEVYHLEGGILQYLEDVRGTSKTWQGGCFVFDQRRAVDA